MSGAVGLAWDLFATDKASPAFLRVAGAADKAAASTAKASLTMEQSIARMGKVGGKLTKALTVPLLAVGVASVVEAAKWQKSMTLIQTAGGETAAKTTALSKGLMKVATETGTSLHDLGEGIYTVAKAGGAKWSANEQLLIMKAAAQGAKAEHVDLGTATSALTSVMMSYHLSASKAVETENMLIRGSGLAKTSMQNYAAALSTVVPVASAAGISFAQVAGAIATMTQHGTSADEATQELSHTIRNLLSPNQVAQKAMQQLGLSVTDVTSNLGKRGLTGTIDLITNAIEKKMGPAGMVVTSVFKQSQAATADLNSMLTSMPTSLGKLSTGLLSGSVGISAYKKAVQELGGTAGAQGLQFLSLYKSSKGFNDLLKSGQPQARTFAGALKQVLGTATSMNTALQLGGENMAYFKQATNDVAKAARSTGVDVLGWAKTQDTFAVKMDRAKASLQVMAVEIGTQLLPAVTKLADLGIKAAHWFDGLSHTQKVVMGWSVGVLAALGPLLSLGARLALVGRGIGSFVGGASSRLATFAGASEVSAMRVSVAMRGMTAALAGAGIGFAIGSLTKNSGTATKALGVLGSATAGAAIGFGAGGPLGAAIGGLAGGLTSLAAGFLGAGHAAKASIKATDDYTQAILADSDAVGVNTRKLVENDLQKRGLYDAGLKLGISQKTLTDAALGNTAALNKVNSAQAGVTVSVLGAVHAHHALTKQQEAQNKASSQLSSGLGVLSTTLKVNQHAADNLAAADGKVKSGTGAVGSAAVTTTGKLNNLNIAGTGLDKALRNLAKQHKIGVDTSQATGQVDTLRNSLDSLYAAILNPPSAPKIKGPSIPGVTVPGLLGGANAKGTSGLADGYFTVGEQGWELGHKSGGNVQLWDNKTSQKMTGMSKVPGYATGTSPSMSADWSSISTFLATARATASAASELSDAAKSLRSAAADNKVSSAEQARLARDSSVLGRLASARDRISAKLGTSNYTAPTAYDRLGTAQSAYSDSATTTRQAVMGSFDITTAGQNSWGVSTTAGILGAIQKAAANAGRFATLVKRLAKEGLNRHLVEQLTAAGPSALGAAEALAKATPKQLATINSAYKSITNTGYSLGTAVADDFYKAGVTSAEALVKGLLTKRSLLNKTISNLAGEMVISLENSLGLASGHMTKAQYTRAEKKLEATFNIQGVTDPEAFAQAVARRLATLVA